MKMLLVATLFVSGVFATDGPVREVQSECFEPSGQPICVFRNGYLFKFSAQFDRVMRVYAPDGHFALNVPIYLPGADSAWAEDVAVDSDGKFVVAAAGTTSGTTGDRHGLVMLDSNGLQTSFIDTKAFGPGHLAIASDHSIWVLGSRGRSKKGEDYMILRKYSRHGELQGSYLPRSTFAQGTEPGSAGIFESVMTAENRVVVVAVSGQNSSLRELIELDGNGNVLGRMRSDHDGVMQFAFTTDGHLYGWRCVRETKCVPTLALFDVAAGSSKNLDTLQPFFSLLGADGEDLVYRIPGGDERVKAAWFEQPSAIP
jgi:hypothetical protein